MIPLTEDRFKCKCCGVVKMDPLFLTDLNWAQEIAELDFIIVSGYRCPKHNIAVGSKTNNHPAGKAADIFAGNAITRARILRALFLGGFRRVGIGKTFIHVDKTTKGEACWLY